MRRTIDMGGSWEFYPLYGNGLRHLSLPDELPESGEHYGTVGDGRLPVSPCAILPSGRYLRLSRTVERR